MNRNKSQKVSNPRRDSNNYDYNNFDNDLNNNNRGLMRMNVFENFDKMFDNFAMPKFNMNSGIDRFFGEFESNFSSGFENGSSMISK